MYPALLALLESTFFFFFFFASWAYNYIISGLLPYSKPEAIMKTTSARLSAVLRNIAGCLCALQYCTLYSVYVYICIHYNKYI